MDWKRGPPVLVGEKVLWSGIGCSKPKNGVIKWIGSIPDLSSDWCVGIELEVALPSLGGDGYWKGRKLFECREKHGLLVPIEEIRKIDSKKHVRPISAENYSHFNLDDSQLRDCTRSDLRYKSYKKIQLKNPYSASGSKSIEESNRPFGFDSIKENRRSISGGQQTAWLENQKLESSPRKKTRERKELKDLVKNCEEQTCSSSEIFETSNNFDSPVFRHEFLRSMNEVAGYFKEIKEGDELFDKHEQTDNLPICDTNEQGHSKPKKLFSFLKWFNKKQKQEPNLKLFRDSSATSSPMFPRREISSCESIDTLFSTQTVRSFAYIPPTQYKPSAPPLDFDKSSYENLAEDVTTQKNAKVETESIYDRRKKRRAPEPPRLSRENSLPTTLEHKKNNEDFGDVKTFHRRTVSESFKDKKAGAYCHVQGKRKAPPPPAPNLYPNLQKVNNPYPSLYKKKKPAPPPPEVNSERNQAKKDVTTDQPIDETKKEKPQDLKDVGNNEKGIQLNQTNKGRLTKDSSLSPLPSRPWYKRSHRDSTGSNIIRKDLLKGFDKKKNKETDDWMPEVGFPRRSLSTESHSKFNIFSKLEKTEEKKKEEKRKSQISILTNISELDREAAEIVRKEQAQEKKMLAANDAKYYLSKRSNEKINEPASVPAANFYKEKGKPYGTDVSQAQAVGEVKSGEEKVERADEVKIKEEKLKDKENNLNPENQANDNPKPNPFSPNVLADLTNSTSLSPLAKISKPNQNPSQARLNYFNVQNKELNYLNEPWVCQKCTLENPGWRVFCEMCSSVKPRFTFNKPTQDTQQAKEDTKMEAPSSETDKGKELKETEETKTTLKNEEAKEIPWTETLDELRKKRMSFFSSKLETLPESDKSEPGSLNNTKQTKGVKEMRDSSENTKQTKGVKEMRDSSESIEEKNVRSDLERKQKEENIKHTRNQVEGENIKEKPNKETTVKEKSEENDEGRNEKREQDEKSKVKPGPSSSQNESKDGQSIQQKPGEPEKVVEAYIITKTIVLEDIIKRPNRGRKVSASVQTKCSRSVSPETKAVKPPPRTKKIMFDTNGENHKSRESESPSENGLGRNYKQEDLEELTTKLTQAEGLADFRANIEAMPLNTEMNTVAVNRLLRKLETAINCGDQFVAAGLAKELAQLKINCSVTRQITPSPSTSKITIDLYIEDKISHQGPIPLEVSPTMSLLQLKKKIQQELGIPLGVQRWILGKKLATDDNRTLEEEGVKSDYCPLFLYLVAPDNRKSDKEDLSKTEKNSEENAAQEQQPIEDKSFHPKGKGWYYNYEEDHYSYCEDSEDDLSDTALNKTKETSPKNENNLKIVENIKKTETEGNKKAEQPPVFDLKSKDAENDLEKEPKLIPANSVRQKVEKLNKTFAENATAVKPPLRSSHSPETWKCGACNIVNSPEKLSCLSCKAKKVIVGPYNRKINNGKEPAKKETSLKENAKPADDNVHYKALMELQEADLVPNSEPFNCPVCMTDYNPGEGVTLKDCLHTFCRTCLVSTVQFSEDAEVKCPYLDDTYSCSSVLQQREIRALVPKGVFELHLAKSVKEAENKIDNAFHCKTPDCKGWCIYEDNVNEFRCPVCRFTNCLTCQAIHTGINCREYQERMNDASETDVDAKKTRDMLNEMVEKGEAMACPKCQVVLMKKWGCDWLRCSMCKTEICWVTRGFRWGPEGKGDTSGGCKCGVNGVKCHPKCNYCH